MSEADLVARLSARIDALESREAITGLIHAYARYVRLETPQRCLELLWPDAEIELWHADPEHPGEGIPHRHFVGHDGIRSSFVETAGASARIWPMIHNVEIELDGDRASATCVMDSAIWPHGMQYVGEYSDRFERRGGVWKFVYRRYLIFGNASGEYAAEAYRTYEAAKEAIGDG